MVDEEFEGWRITVADDGSEVFFSNRPMIEQHQMEADLKQIHTVPPDHKCIGLPLAVIERARDLARGV